MRHVVYLTELFNGSNKYWYIGKHSTRNLCDGYIGSGLIVKRMVNAGYTANRTIIKEFNTSKDALDYESRIIPIFKRRYGTFDKNGKMLNITDGGEGGLGFTSEQAAKYQRKRVADGTHHCLNVRPWNHIRQTDETIELWSRAVTYHSLWMSGLGYVASAKKLGFTKPKKTHQNMFKLFDKGWNPLTDESWINKFRIVINKVN